MESLVRLVSFLGFLGRQEVSSVNRMGQQVEGVSDNNTFDFVPGTNVLSWDWRNLGTIFNHVGAPQKNAQTFAGKCTFVVKRGIDPLGGLPIGRTLEASGDLGLNFKYQKYGLHVSVGNLWFKSGVDDPVKAQIENTQLPSIKVTLAKQLAKNEDEYVAASYDLKRLAPELSYCFSSTTLDSKASLLLTLNPKDVSLKVAAAVELPGPEWRVDLLDEIEDKFIPVTDDGCRHRFFLQHEVNRTDFLAKTNIGCKLSLHRTVNYVINYLDNEWRYRIPDIVYRIPLAEQLVNFLLPEDQEDDQIRVNLKGWELDIQHDFDAPRTVMGLTKRMKYDAISCNYDWWDRSVGLEYARKAVKMGFRLGQLEGAGWKKPSIHFTVEPLAGLD